MQSAKFVSLFVNPSLNLLEGIQILLTKHIDHVQFIKIDISQKFHHRCIKMVKRMLREWNK